MRKTPGLFSRGIEREHWPEMGEVEIIYKVPLERKHF